MIRHNLHQGYLGASLQGVHLSGGAKNGNFQHFLEIFRKFVNRDARKIGFWVVLVDISRNFRKNAKFWEKNTSTNGQKFGDTSTKVPPPKQ